MKQLKANNILNNDGVYLTFDDGPEPGITEFVLNELSRYNAKATFFCVGENIEKYPHLYEHIVIILNNLILLYAHIYFVLNGVH